jgi:hypothetical protein
MLIVQDLKMVENPRWFDNKDHYSERMDLPESKEIILNSKAIETIGCTVSPITLILFCYS